MSEALNLLKTRKSVAAAFLGAPGPDDAALAEILAVAARVPDHGRLAPWRFIVFKGDARKQAGEILAALFQKKNPEAQQKQIDDEKIRLARAPVVIAVVSKAAPHPKIPEWEQILSGGAVAMNVVLSAQALGYGAQWTTGWIAFDEDAGRVLGLNPGERFVGFIHIGTPTAPSPERPRPSATEVVTYWKPAG